MRSPLRWQRAIIKSRCGIRSTRGGSLPLDGTGRLGSNVVDDSVDAGDFVRDSAADLGQEFVGQAGPVRCHRVIAGNGTQSDDVAVGAVVALDADGLSVGQDGEGLPE